MDRDITDILQEAAEEAYEDDFATDNDVSDHGSSIKPSSETRNSPVQSVAASLQNAARDLETEEAEEARERLIDTAAEIRQTVEPHRPAEPKPDNPRLKSRSAQSADSDDDIGAALTRADNAITKKYHEETPQSPEVSDNEADYEPQDFDVDAELIQLCYQNRIDDIVRRFRKGGSILCVDQHGWTTLHWAAAHNKVEMLEYLLQETPAGSTRSYINHKEKIVGYTPLHMACIGGHTECVILLKKYDARTTTRNNLEETPADCLGVSIKSKQGKAIAKLLGIKIELDQDEAK